MSSCSTDFQLRSFKVGSPSEAGSIRASEKPRGKSLPKTKGTPEAKDKLKKARLVLSHVTRFFRKSLSVCLTASVWLFMADFLFQFAHVHRDGKSLAGVVHTVVSLIQTPLESLIGFDARYQFPVSNVDFMPLIIFVALLILRNRADSLLARAERLVRGEEKKTLQLYRSRSGNHSGLGLNNQPPKGHRQGGDDRHVLRNKALAIFSD